MTQERQERTTARSTRVLILDEDRVEGGMLAFHLRREGLVVMLMTSAEEAADAIAWAEPDVLLVEVAAQGFDGREFLQQLGHLSVDVFAVADRQLPAEVELDALRLGVIDIMMKPIDPVTLARRLKARPERQRRGSAAGLPEGGIAGDLAVHSVVYLLQMAHRHRMNARLHIEIDGDWAVLLVRHGEVIDAEAPSATGREAAFQMIRAQQGAFVWFPLAGDAEELSRDDVIRADLATLVADAMGRKEPRTVNVVRAREPEFVLPHVGSPRGPLSRQKSEETLEYAAAQPPTEPPAATTSARDIKTNDSARVKRPGEKEREEPEAGREAPKRQPTAPIHLAATPPSREEARPMVRTDAVQAQRELTNPGGIQAMPNDLAVMSTMRTVDNMRSPIESPTVDEGYFDEATDQTQKKRPRAGYIAGQKRGQPAAASPGPTTASGLRRVSGGSQALPVRTAAKTDPELDGYEDHGGRRARRSGARPAWSLPTMVMAGAAVVLALFIGVRLATKDGGEAAAPIDTSADPQLKLGQALIDLDEGRRDQARTALAALAVEASAPSEVLAALARMHYQDGRLVEAQSLLERIVERNPGDADALAWLGLVQAGR